MKTSRAINALAVVLGSIAIVGGAVPSTVLANGIGDLYAGVPGGLIELHMASSSIVNQLDFEPPAESLAFSNDGRTLWAARAQASLTRIDIETISIGVPIKLTGPALAVVVPEGNSALVAVKGESKVSIVEPTRDGVRESRALPAEPDLLAANRHEPLAVAARRGGRWIAIVDPATGAVQTLKVDGAIVGVAVDQRGGVGYAVTTGPARLWRIRLRDPKITDRVDLAVASTAVVATAKGPVVAAGREIWIVGSSVARLLAKTDADISTITASDDGELVYLGGADSVSAIDLKGKLLSTFSLPDRQNPTALAAIPAPSSLGAGAGGGSVPPPNAPVTSTMPIPIPPAVKPLAGAVLVFGLILAIFMVGARVRRFALEHKHGSG